MCRVQVASKVASQPNHPVSVREPMGFSPPGDRIWMLCSSRNWYLLRMCFAICLACVIFFRWQCLMIWKCFPRVALKHRYNYHITREKILHSHLLEMQSLCAPFLLVSMHFLCALSHYLQLVVRSVYNALKSVEFAEMRTFKNAISADLIIVSNVQFEDSRMHR